MRRGLSTAPQIVLVQICGPCAGTRTVKGQHRAFSTALSVRKVKGRFHVRHECADRRGNVHMPRNTQVPTQDAYRSSRTGRFVTERQAERYPNTHEHERIKHPKN